MKAHRFVLAAAFAAFSATAAEAQYDRPTVGFEVTPYAGFMHFGDLFEFSDGRDLSMKDAALLGAQAGIHLGSSWAVLGNFGWASSQFTNDFPSSPTQTVSPDVNVFLYDGSLQYRIPMYGAVRPFIQGGVGGIRYRFDDDLNGDRGSSDVAFNAGVGADVQLGRTLGLRLMAKDYITSLSWDDLDAVDFDDGIKGNTAHNLGFSVGLKLGW
jgi:hypothetical protein